MVSKQTSESQSQSLGQSTSHTSPLTTWMSLLFFIVYGYSKLLWTGPTLALNLAPLGFHQVLYFNVVSGERATQDAVKDMRWNTWSCPMAWHTYLDEGDRLDHRDWCWRLNRGKGYFNDIQRWPWITRNWLIQSRLSLGTRNLERRGKVQRQLILQTCPLFC